MNADFQRKPSADRLPKAIGPYAIRARIGRGAMGVVYRAVDERTNASVALKAMASDLDGDAETCERFFREAHVAGKLRHRNIVTVIDSGEDAGRLYIAMELLTGGTLAEVCKESNPLDLEDRIDVMIQVCQGLNVAHHAGVFHRDLKPANLFLCEDGRVKILDFGVARLVGSNMTVTGNIIGTPDFMSPEQVRGHDVDSRSDIFSLGSVFYYLLTGRKPFTANDLPTVLHKVVRSQPLPLRDDEAPEAVAAVIRKSMSKDPAARQQTVEALTCELIAAAHAVEVATREAALKVRAMGEDIRRLVQRGRELASVLELPEGTLQDPWQAIVERFPVLKTGPHVLGVYPLRLAIVKEIEQLAATEFETLQRTVELWVEGHAQLMDGLGLQRTGAVHEAAEKFAAARAAVSSSPAIERAIQVCAQAIDAKRERQALLQAKLTLARNAASRAEWPAVLSIVTEIDEIDPQSSTAHRLRAEAVTNLREAPPPAERASGIRSQPGTHRLRSIAQTADGSDGEFPSEAEPGDMSAETYLDLPPAERTGTVARLNAEALQHLLANDLTVAERIAAQSVALDANSEDARHLLERVRTEIALRNEKAGRRREITELLRRSEALAERKEFAKALKLADDALTLDATDAPALALRVQICSDREVHDAESAARTARLQRARAAAPAISESRRALAAREFERARWSAETALALDPQSEEARLLLAHIDQAMPQPAADDTVKLDDPQSDTAVMTWRQVTVGQRFAQVREQAVFWIQRWRKTDTREER